MSPASRSRDAPSGRVSPLPCPARPLGPCRLSSGLLHPRAALCQPRAPGSPQCRDKAPREGGRHPHVPRCVALGYARRQRDVISACSDIITQARKGKGRRSRASRGRAGDGVAVLKSSAAAAALGHRVEPPREGTTHGLDAGTAEPAGSPGVKSTHLGWGRGEANEKRRENNDIFN